MELRPRDFGSSESGCSDLVVLGAQNLGKNWGARTAWFGELITGELEGSDHLVVGARKLEKDGRARISKL